MITANKNGIIELWQNTFGDSREYVENFIKTFSDKAKFLTKEIEGKTASMLCMIDCYLETGFDKYKTKYIYACATAEEYKKRGLISELLEEAREEAEKEGCCFLVLVPATESLFDFYEKRGYQRFFKVKKTELSPKIMKIISKGDKVNSSADVQAINNLRENFLTHKPCILWADEQIEFIKTVYPQSGGKVLFSEDVGYAFVRTENNIAYIDEICASAENFCEMIKIIYDNCKADKYCFFTPIDCPLTADDFDVKDKGMILSLKNKIYSDGYIGLVME